MSRKPPSADTPYDPDDYIDVDYSDSPFFQKIKAFYANRPPYVELSSDTDTEDGDGDGGLLTPRSLSPQAQRATEGPSTISLYNPDTASQNPISTAPSPTAIPQGCSLMYQTTEWTVPQPQRRMTRSCRVVAFVSLSYDSRNAIVTQSRENVIHIAPDDVLNQMVCLDHSAR